MWGVFAPLNAQAEEYVLCLQKQLSILGFDPGPHDCAWGQRTKAAALALRKSDARLQANPMLDNPRRVSAVSWCRVVGQLNPEVKKFRPSEASVVFLKDDDATVEEIVIIRAAVREAKKYFKFKHQIELAGRIDFVAGGDHEQIARNLIQLRRARGETTKNVRRFVRKKCEGTKRWYAAAYFNQVFSCWPDNVAHYKTWLEKNKRLLSGIMVHELAHSIQTELTLAKTILRLRKDGRWIDGPGWMVEGSAMMFELDYLYPEFKGRWMPSFQTLMAPARMSSLKLRKTGYVVTDEEYDVSRFAAYLLAKRYGLKSFNDYWREIGQGKDWNAAFQATYGMSIREFEAIFEELRHDLKAAIIFARPQA
jgi:hypothetical protein